jgi:hypothetical protein
MWGRLYGVFNISPQDPILLAAYDDTIAQASKDPINHQIDMKGFLKSLTQLKSTQRNTILSRMAAESFEKVEIDRVN